MSSLRENLHMAGYTQYPAICTLNTVHSIINTLAYAQMFTYKCKLEQIEAHLQRTHVFKCRENTESRGPEDIHKEKRHGGVIQLNGKIN